MRTLCVLLCLATRAAPASCDDATTCDDKGSTLVEDQGRQLAEAARPRVVIGCWQLLERDADESHAVATLAAYFEAGFTAFDTADIYGRSEALLGQLRQRGVVPTIYTKYVTQDGGLANARAINAQSRRALGGPPALVQFHCACASAAPASAHAWGLINWLCLAGWDYSDPAYTDAARHLATLRAEGLLGEVAACNFDVAHLRPVVDGLAAAGVPLVANQVQYSLHDCMLRGPPSRRARSQRP